MADARKAPALGFPVVGIGASAGGLEAFIEFFKAVPENPGMAFVLILHLPPKGESIMPEILSRTTSLPVQAIEDGMKVEANHVYTIRPGRTVIIKGGVLHLLDSVAKPGHQRPVDDFFRAMAEDQLEHGIAIVMSGMGSNGTAGAKAVKAAGGLCIAQDPETAKYPSMPKSLIESGVADFVLKLREMPEVLNRYANQPYENGRADDTVEIQDQQSLNLILSAVRMHAKHDFSGYKKPTIVRRIQRRMGLHQIAKIGDYAKLVRTNPAEVSMLADDLMIHVTGFFRDPEVWQKLSADVVRPLMAGRKEGSQVRAWVTACATGEEAYSLAILLAEAQESAGKRFDLKVFATDTAEKSLKQARAGVYAGGIESDLSPERLERFFSSDGPMYRVKKEIRDIVTFAPQNLLQDPPFSRLDICTCRNLLIYLEPEMQDRILSLLHFSLRPGGVLVLGTSETVSGLEDCFEPLDKKMKFFRRIGARHGTAVDFPPLRSLYGAIKKDGAAQVQEQKTDVAAMAERALLDHFAPASVVIDTEFRIVYFHGDTARYLKPQRGEPTQDLVSLLPEEFHEGIKSAIKEAASGEGPGTARGHIGDHVGIEIAIAALDPATGPNYFLVSFAPLGPTGESPGAAGAASQLVDDDLRRLKSALGRSREEYQSSVELLRASNEEITSINEELQSTNEELETGKEELQSLNEELTTANSQLQSKMEELEATTNDLTSLLSSTDIAVIFLDRSRRIRRFTPSARELVDVIPTDIGRNMSDLALKFDDPSFYSDIDSVLEKLVPSEKEIQSRSGRVYWRRILPYRTAEGKVGGVVVTFVDVTVRERAEANLRRSEELYRIVLDGLTEHAIVILDTEGHFVSWPASAERIFGYSSGETLGHAFSSVFGDEKGRDELAKAKIDESVRKGGASDERWFRRKDGTIFWGQSSLSALKDASGKLLGFVQVLRDNSERKAAQEALERAKLAAELANSAKDDFLANVSHELRTPLASILLWTTLLKESADDKPLASEGMAAIRDSAEQQKTLIEDLLDTARIESGKLRLDRVRTSMAGIIESAVHTLLPSADTKGVKISLELDANLGDAMVDPMRFQQVIWNLVGNAVKFTPRGGSVTVKGGRDDGGITIQVADTGDGIDGKVMPLIFRRFGQAPQGTRRATSGLGLGLSISLHLVELHGGTLLAASEGPGKGATFTVHLPVEPINKEKPEASAAEPGAASAQLKGRRILLVEDDPQILRVLRLILESNGAVVDTAENSGKALEKFERAKPDFIVSDVGLPDMDGNELMRRIRIREAELKVRRVPAVALTAFAGERSKAAALGSGFDAWVAKPAEPSQILRELEALTRRL
jgi:two-component system CheB/CheR fusion protein